MAPSLTSLFVSIYNYVISGSLQYHNFDYVLIRLFVVRLDYVPKHFIFVTVTYLSLRFNYVINAFVTTTCF